MVWDAAYDDRGYEGAWDASIVLGPVAVALTWLGAYLLSGQLAPDERGAARGLVGCAGILMTVFALFCALVMHTFS